MLEWKSWHACHSVWHIAFHRIPNLRFGMNTHFVCLFGVKFESSRDCRFQTMLRSIQFLSKSSRWKIEYTKCAQIDDSDDDDDQRQIGIIKIPRIAHEHSSVGSWFKCFNSSYAVSTRARRIFAKGREIISYYRIIASMNSFRNSHHSYRNVNSRRHARKNLRRNIVSEWRRLRLLPIVYRIVGECIIISIRKHIEHTWLCA